MKQKSTLVNLLDSAQSILNTCELMLESDDRDIRWTLKHQVSALNSALWTTRRLVAEIITEEE